MGWKGYEKEISFYRKEGYMKRIDNKKRNVLAYLHSKCCMAHWELSVNDKGLYDLTCEKCGKPIGDAVIVMGNVKIKEADGMDTFT
jgi:hypothetical protein